MPPKNKKPVAKVKRGPVKTSKELTIERKLKKIHIVLDLDATLLESRLDAKECDLFGKKVEAVLSKNSVEETKEFRQRYFDYRFSGSRGITILRPHSKEFIHFATKYFATISIFTAAIREYADFMVNLLFDYPRPDIILSREECKIIEGDKTGKKSSPSSRDEDEDDDKPFIKPLKLIGDHLGITSKEDFMKDVLLIDDRDDIARDNPNNLIHIPPFEIKKVTKENLFKQDKRLEEFINWLITEEVLNYEDVRKLDKTKIFSS